MTSLDATLPRPRPQAVAGRPDRLPALTAALEALPAQPSAAGRTAATALAHRLHGTAGSYGLHAVSAAAGAIEHALLPTTLDLAAITAELHVLRDAITKLTDGTLPGAGASTP